MPETDTGRRGTGTGPAGALRTPLTLLTTAGRAGQPFRLRLGATFATVAGLHVLGLSLLTIGVAAAGAGAAAVGLAAFAYARGLVHAFDFDHVSMIDNSTRKFVAEGRRPASVGLAFSAGHSTVVVVVGTLVVLGTGAIEEAVLAASDQSSGAGRVLGLIGLSVSGLYLVLVALSNLATFLASWRLRQALRADPLLVVTAEALSPRGPAARAMAAPLRRVRHPRHIYVIGFLFSLGFDTSSQIGLLIITRAAALAGAPTVALLALPVLFAAAMTLGDTSNGLMMLRLYEAAQQHPARKVNFNLLVTGVGIASGLSVGVLALAGLLREAGVRARLVETLTDVDTTYAGFALAVGFVAIGLSAALVWRRATDLARRRGV
ncbi:MAG: HoxN/HupN/NixA family nickel/cobalt transporter [Actinomycetes bacterium]